MLKDELLNYLRGILVYNQQASYKPATRETAIEYLKENRYSMTEENVLYAMKKLSENGKASDVDMSQYMAMNIEEIINIYNENLAIPSNMVKQPVHPSLLLRQNEEVRCVFYTHNRIDRRTNNQLSEDVYRAFDYGNIGRGYITDTRIIANYSPTIYPFLGTVCFDIKDIVSMSISGFAADSIDIVLSSGQRISFPICEYQMSIVDLFMFIDRKR